MSNKPFFLALIQAFDALWQEGVHVLVFKNRDKTISKSKKGHLFSALLIFKDRVMVTFSKGEECYHFSYDVKKDEFMFNDQVFDASFYH
eukprot:COSAG05_NODE_6815_length_898_cov_1.103880_2_plen_89_part_00